MSLLHVKKLSLLFIASASIDIFYGKFVYLFEYASKTNILAFLFADWFKNYRYSGIKSYKLSNGNVEC